MASHTEFIQFFIDSQPSFSLFAYPQNSHKTLEKEKIKKLVLEVEEN